MKRAAAAVATAAVKKSKMSAYARERAVAVEAVLRASALCQRVFKHVVAGQTALTKEDKSPVTIADFGAQALVNSLLHRHFPDDPIVGEEDSADLQKDPRLRDKVLDLVNGVLADENVLVVSDAAAAATEGEAEGEGVGEVKKKEKDEEKEEKMSAEEMLRCIDLGNYAGGPKGRFWTLDPIDGTKGFLRGEQFAVCLALVEDGKVNFGVLGCPNLPLDLAKPDGERGSLFIAARGEGAYQRPFSTSTETRIHASAVTDPSQTFFCESVEAGHSSQSDAARIGALLGLSRDSVRMDSQCKYGVVARGEAGIYLRLPVSEAYQEKIWDHAAGSLLIEESGGVVTDVHGRPLDFSRGRTLAGNKGVVAAAPGVAAAVMAAVSKVLEENKEKKKEKEEKEKEGEKKKEGEKGAKGGAASL